MACDQVIDSYDIGSATPAINALGEGSGQAITMSGNHTLCGAKGYFTKSGTCNFKVKAILYACTGTPGTNGVPTGSALATSNEVDSSAFATHPSYDYTAFTFGTPYSLIDGTNYCIIFEITSYTSGTLYPVYNDTAVTHSGNRCWNVGAGWTSNNTHDCRFFIYEESAAGVAPTSIFYGPFVGPLGGPI